MLADARRRSVDAPGRVGEVDEVPELAHRAHDRVLVVDDHAEPLDVRVVQRELAALHVDRDLVGDARVVEHVRPRHRRLRAGSPPRAAARPRHGRARGRGPRRRRSARQNASQCVVAQRRDLDPAVLGLVQPVARREPVLRRRRAWAGTRACRRRAAACRTRTPRRRPSGSSTAPGPRRSCAGGTARRARRRPTASRSRRRTCRSGSRAGRGRGAPRRPRARARPTPGTAGRGRRSAPADPRARTRTCCSRRRRASPPGTPRSRVLSAVGGALRHVVVDDVGRRDELASRSRDPRAS